MHDDDELKSYDNPRVHRTAQKDGDGRDGALDDWNRHFCRPVPLVLARQNCARRSLVRRYTNTDICPYRVDSLAHQVPTVSFDIS
jgi:hypothetical protein